MSAEWLHHNGYNLDRISERFRNDVLALNLSVPKEDLIGISRVIGLDPCKIDIDSPISSSEAERTLRWIKSGARRHFEKTLARVIFSFGARLQMEKTAQRIEELYGPPRYYVFEGGFFQGDSDPPFLTSPITKIRTMKHEAAKKLKSPFDHTTFLAGQPFKQDDRVLGDYALDVRKKRKDEIPQISQVIKGEMDLFGVRGYTEEELWGVMILWNLRNDLGIKRMSGEVRRILEIYPKAVRLVQPRCGIVSPHSAFKVKETLHGVRMIGDFLYWRYANPKIDFYLAFNTFIRLIQGVGAR